MAENETPLPSFSLEGDQQRDKEIIKSTVGLRKEGGTIAQAAGALASGTVLGRLDANDKYVAYDDTNMDGSETAVAVLAKAVDATDGDVLGEIIVGGVLKHDQLVGLDAAAVTDLNGREDTVRNEFSF